jgi:hypothetical protein
MAVFFFIGSESLSPKSSYAHRSVPEFESLNSTPFLSCPRPRPRFAQSWRRTTSCLATLSRPKRHRPSTGSRRYTRTFLCYLVFFSKFKRGSSDGILSFMKDCIRDVPPTVLVEAHSDIFPHFFLLRSTPSPTPTPTSCCTHVLAVWTSRHYSPPHTPTLTPTTPTPSPHHHTSPMSPTATIAIRHTHPTPRTQEHTQATIDLLSDSRALEEATLVFPELPPLEGLFEAVMQCTVL